MERGKKNARCFPSTVWLQNGVCWGKEHGLFFDMIIYLLAVQAFSSACLHFILALSYKESKGWQCMRYLN